MDGLSAGQRLLVYAARNVLSFGFVKVQKTIDSAIRAFTVAFFQWTRADERQGPVLELEFVELREALGAFEIGRLAFLFKLDVLAKSVFQTALNQIDREISDIDANPLPPQLLCCVNGCAASTEWIEHDIAGIARRTDNALKKRLRLLCWIAQTFLCLCADRLYIKPEILKRYAFISSR